MSKIEMLRLLISQRLTAAAEEIFGAFGRTVAEYEEEISRFKLEIERQRRLLDLSRTPQISVHADSSALSEPQDWTCSLDASESMPPHIKKEEEPWEPQQEETPQRAEQNDITPPSSQSGSETNKQNGDRMISSLPQHALGDQVGSDADLQPGSEAQGSEAQHACSDSSPGPAVDRDAASAHGQLDGVEVEVPPSEVVNLLAKRHPRAKHGQSKRKASSRAENKADKSYTCDICGKRLTRIDGYQKHLRVHTGEKPYGCDECGRRFSDYSNYKKHLRTHARQKKQQS